MTFVFNILIVFCIVSVILFFAKEISGIYGIIYGLNTDINYLKNKLDTEKTLDELEKELSDIKINGEEEI